MDERDIETKIWRGGVMKARQKVLLTKTSAVSSATEFEIRTIHPFV